jgi:hypothetical protein
MIITENNIEKALLYFDKLDDTKYEKLIDELLQEQAYLSTFVQQNLDNIFAENENIKDISYNLYFIILHLYKAKLEHKYPIINKEKLDTFLSGNNEVTHKQEDLGDFIFTQLATSEIEKPDIIAIIGLLNIVINCFE